MKYKEIVNKVSRLFKLQLTMTSWAQHYMKKQRTISRNPKLPPDWQKELTKILRLKDKQVYGALTVIDKRFCNELYLKYKPKNPWDDYLI